MKTLWFCVVVLVMALLACKSTKEDARLACEEVAASSCSDWSDVDVPPKWQRGSTSLYVGGDQLPGSEGRTIYTVQCAMFETGNGAKAAYSNAEDVKPVSAFRKNNIVCAVFKDYTGAMKRASKWSE
jgi:hypothetical protein